MIPPALFFFLKIVLGSFVFLYRFQNYSNSVENAIDILIGIVLNLQNALVITMLILTISTLLIHEHELFFHLFVSCSTYFICALQFSELFYFISVLQLSEYRSFSSFIPGYFILFDVLINGIVFLASLSDSCQCIEMQQMEYYSAIKRMNSCRLQEYRQTQSALC